MSNTPVVLDPFAKAKDYTDRGYDASVWGAGVLDVRLADASDWLRVNAPGIDERIATGALPKSVVTATVCQMVARSAPVDELPYGIDTVQQGAGPFNGSMKRTNPHGDFYLTKQEKLTLGVGGRAWSVDLMPNPDKPRF